MAEEIIEAGGIGKVAEVHMMAYGNKLNAPEPVLKLPFKAGEKWEDSPRPKNGAVAEN